MCGSAVTPYQLQYQLKAKSFPVLCNLALKSATCHYSMYLPLSYCRNTIWGKHTQTHKAMVNLSAPTHCDASGRSPFAKWEKKNSWVWSTHNTSAHNEVPFICTQIKQEWQKLKALPTSEIRIKLYDMVFHCSARGWTCNLLLINSNFEENVQILSCPPCVLSHNS